MVTLYSKFCSEAIAQKLKQSQEDTLQLERAEQLLENNSTDEEEIFTIAHQILKTTQDLNSSIKANNDLAVYHCKKYSSDSAILYAERVLDLVDENRDDYFNAALSSSYAVLSQASSDKNLVQESKKWALKGIALCREYNMENKGIHTANLAVSYRLEGDPEKALELFKNNEDIREKPNYYSSIALCYMDLQKYEKGLEFFKKALAYFTSINDQRKIATANLNIGVVYLNLYKDDLALSYLNNASKFAKENDYPLIAVNSLLNINEIYVYQKRYGRAVQTFEEALQIAKKNGYFKQQLFIYKNLRAIAVERKDFQSALTYADKTNALKDSINDLQRDKEIAKLEVEYETLKKEQQIAKLKNQETLKNFEIQKQSSYKKIILYAFLIILLPLAGLAFQYKQKIKNQHVINQKEKEINKQKIDTLIKEHELKLIKTSLTVQDAERRRIAQELHDRIGGNLAAIILQLSSLKDHKNDLEPIHNQLDETYNQVRVLSHELIPEKFGNQNFIALLNDYMTTIGNTSNLYIRIDTYQEKKIDGLHPSFHSELFSVFQELITNTIKHANAKNVEIQIDFLDDELTVVFEDDGDGFDHHSVSIGIGLSNIQNRIENLRGSMNIDSNPKRGTIITIEIPIQALEAPKQVYS